MLEWLKNKYPEIHQENEKGKNEAIEILTSRFGMKEWPRMTPREDGIIELVGGQALVCANIVDHDVDGYWVELKLPAWKMKELLAIIDNSR